MINIGIIGHGRVAVRHVMALKEVNGARLWSVCGTDLLRAQNFATMYGAEAKTNSFIDVDKMFLDPDLDAVIIATPDMLHFTHTLLAMKSGKSVLIEKPLCTSLTEVNQLLAEHQQYTKNLAVGYHLRWNSGLKNLAALCHRNELGTINHMRLQWAVNFIDHAAWRINPHKKTWCCLSALGTHLMDLAKWIMVPICGEVKEIKSFVKKIDATESDGSNLIIIEFQSGATVEINCSILYDLPFNLDIYAEKGNVCGTNLAGEFEQRKITINGKELYYENHNPYVIQLKDFVQSILENRQPTVPLQVGIDNVRDLFAVYPI